MKTVQPFQKPIRLMLVLGFLLSLNVLQAQIYEPEGLSMPGEWNGWTNPPTNNLALASSTQVAGGQIVKITTGTPRWQTIFSVAASGADLVGGTYNWLFTSGPEANPFSNKWAGVNTDQNTLQTYTYQGATDNNFTISNGFWYTMNWEDSGYEDTRAIFMETSNEPVDILTVSVPTGIEAGEFAAIDISVSAAPSPEELIYVRYSTDGWNTSAISEVDMAGTTGTAGIPGQAEGTTVSYYVFSTTVADITADYDLYTIKFNNNADQNYSYTVEGTAPASIGWANLQWPPNGEAAPGANFNVYAQVFAETITEAVGQGAGITAWIGYSTSDTDPATWTNWVPATYNDDDGNNDEYTANIGAVILTEGTYYYASRFQLNDQAFVYGGYAESGGGFWNGTTNVSGILVVTEDITPAEITFANLQWPENGAIELGGTFEAYAQVYAEGLTEGAGGSDRIQCWIGFSDSDSDPSTWTSWFGAQFNTDAGNNDEYKSNIGPQILNTGTYYYASRFRLDDDDFVYGGFSTSGGGFWDGTNNVSGVLVVTDPIPDPDFDWVNLQYPGSGTVEPGFDYDVYAQAYIEGVTGNDVPAAGVQAWIGYSTDNTNPNTWTNWVAAGFGGPQGDNDEYMANLGAALPGEGTYYYASRFQLDDGDYYYGGYSSGGGGFWNGTTNVSGVVIVQETPPDPEIDWANIQYPGSGTIEPAADYEVYAQVYIDGLTGGDTPAEGVLAWIGYSTSNTNPNSWTNWVPATYNNAVGANDEYMANIGELITEEGTYYYASRFNYDGGTYVYGGFSDNGGGFWDGVNNVSGVLTVEIPNPEISWANLQYPESGEVNVNQVFNVFGRAYIEGVTGFGSVSDDLEAWVGYSTTDSDPAGWTNWVNASFNGSIGSNDEFKANIGALINDPGTYFYATRFRFMDGEFVYGGYAASGGGFWDGINNVSGVLTVTESPTDFPVNFTVIDATFLHDNIKFKGEMTDWQTVPMVQDNNVWTLTLQVAPGSYEWGAIEDDGSVNGIWLIDGPNLVVNVSEEGVITGDTLYTTLITSVEQQSAAAFELYPNPVKNVLHIDAKDGQMEVSFFDLSGRLLQKTMIAGNDQINVADLPKGVYVIELKNAQQLKRLPLIKQ